MKKFIYIFLLILPLSLFSANMNKNGIVTKESNYNVSQTIDMLKAILKFNNLEEITIIDHKKNADENGVDNIYEVKLLILPQSKECLALLEYDAAVGLDLPLKILIYTAKDKKTYVKYRDPKFLKNIYNIGEAKEAIEMSEKIDYFTNVAIK